MELLKVRNPQLYENVQTQLSGFYNTEIGDYKFVKFMLVNNLRSVFNEIKDLSDKKQHSH